MRRQEREIADHQLIEWLLRKGQVLYLAMCDGEQPYVLPLSYGYDGQNLYIHSALEGRKLQVLRRNPRVCFVVEPQRELIASQTPCNWSFRYRSVIGEGTVAIVEDLAERAAALHILMRQHGGVGGDYDSAVLARTMVLKVEITSLSGKQAGYSDG
ncbi:MAG: pyridoxamine 5'-phosphate oxidase family protein [Armatimonadetes bacterium]|nr:pyridoxamine 5'-phosphate oxidase family protein [Armatimonadota bacterium]